MRKSCRSEDSWASSADFNGENILRHFAITVSIKNDPIQWLFGLLKYFCLPKYVFIRGMVVLLPKMIEDNHELKIRREKEIG